MRCQAAGAHTTGRDGRRPAFAAPVLAWHNLGRRHDTAREGLRRCIIPSTAKRVRCRFRQVSEKAAGPHRSSDTVVTRSQPKEAETVRVCPWCVHVSLNLSRRVRCVLPRLEPRPAGRVGRRGIRRIKTHSHIHTPLSIPHGWPSICVKVWPSHHLHTIHTASTSMVMPGAGGPGRSRSATSARSCRWRLGYEGWAMPCPRPSASGDAHGMAWATRRRPSLVGLEPLTPTAARGACDLRRYRRGGHVRCPRRALAVRPAPGQ